MVPRRSALPPAIEEMVGLGAPEELSARVAGLLDVFSLLDIPRSVAAIPTPEVAQIYFQLSERSG
jgi:NAD-specific glutamate dehydrogenase